MAKKRQSRATKIVLASLLAASLSVPSFASAKVAEVTTTNTEIKAEAIKSENAGTIVDFQIFKPGTTELQPGISSHLVTPGTIVEKNGKFEAKLTIAAKSAPMIIGLQTKQGDKFVDATEVKNEDGTITYSFPVVAGKVLVAKIHVVAETPQGKMDKWYDFDLKAVEVATTTKVIEEKTEVKKTESLKEDQKVVTADDENLVYYEGSVTVYKDGTKEESIMKNYINSTILVAKANDAYAAVGMTFPEGQYVQSFKVGGIEAELAEGDGKTNKRFYMFGVKDLNALTEAQIHVIVNEPAAGVKYDSVHTVQLKFDVNLDNPLTETEVIANINPFKDIDNYEHKEAILNLLAYDIIKPQEKFNPNKNLTRAQFALMIARTLELEATEVAGFKDIKGIEAETAINALAEYGIVEAREKFNPNATLTRQQGALMIYRAIQAVTEGELKVDIKLPYADANTIKDNEAKEAFSLLYKEGIMTGSVAKDGKTYINANKPLTRGQMAKILNNSLDFFYEFEE